MNKSELIDRTAKQHNITKVEAAKIINLFTSSVISALGEGKEISLAGFGRFYSSEVPARKGRNPRTGEPIHIEGYMQPRFSAGQVLRDSCNKKMDKH